VETPDFLGLSSREANVLEVEEKLTLVFTGDGKEIVSQDPLPGKTILRKRPIGVSLGNPTLGGG